MAIKHKDGKWVWIPPTELPNLKDAKLVAVDTETKDDGIESKSGPGGTRGLGHLLGVSVAVDKRHSWYFPVNHPETRNWDLGVIARWAKDQFCTPGQAKVGANILYDLEWLRASKVKITGPFYDVQVAEPLIDETKRRYSLSALSEKYLPEEWRKLGDDMEDRAREYLGKFKGDVRGHLWRLPARFVGAYAEMDAISSLLVFEEQKKVLKREDLLRVFDLETRLIPLLLEMRFRGVRVDVDAAERSSKELAAQIKKEHAKLKRMAGMNLNVNASAELAVAFDKLKIPYPRTKKTQAPSFTKDFLPSVTHPIGPQILTVRKLEHLKGTFVDGMILGHVHKGFIYAQFNQLKSDEYGTVSGRFSGSNPNLQQAPSRDQTLGRIIRSCFIPDDPSRLWWKNDWSQIEFRGVVHYAVLEKLGMAEAIAKQYHDDPTTDFHEWAASITGVDRSPAKNINFGVVYGMGLAKLARSLGISIDEAREVMRHYDETLPFIKQLREIVGRTAKRRGYVRTLLGRRRRFNLYEPDVYYAEEEKRPALPYAEAIQAYGSKIRVSGLHKALNAVVQGSAADLMKTAMVQCYEAGLFSTKALSIPSLTVHDELDGDMDKGSAGVKALKRVIEVMETCIPLKVPVLCEAATGKDWWNVAKFQK